MRDTDSDGRRFAELMMVCNVCQPQARMKAADLVRHLLDEHHIVLDFERWPDGEVVVHDTTLEPENFAAGEAQ